MDFDYKKAQIFLKQKKEKKRKINEQLFEKAHRDFNKILSLIILNYNPEKVYQWGSLLDKDSFSDYSDIDIAVKGIKSAEDFFKMYKDIESVTDFSVDLVQFEKIEPEFRDIIELKGKVVYERNS